MALLGVINVEFLWPGLDWKEPCSGNPGGKSCLSKSGLIKQTEP